MTPTSHRDRHRPPELGGRLVELVERMAGRDEVLALYLYGSHGTPHQTPMSDVDLALVVDPPVLEDLDRELELRSEILSVLGAEDVSITFLQRSDPIFQLEVLRTGRRLLCSNEEAVADFVAEVLDRHADYVIDHRAMLRDHDEGLRHERDMRR